MRDRLLGDTAAANCGLMFAIAIWVVINVDVLTIGAKNTAKLPQTGADGLAGSAWRKRIVGRNGERERACSIPRRHRRRRARGQRQTNKKNTHALTIKGAILLDKTEPHRKAGRMFDWSVLASVASSPRAGIAEVSRLCVWGTGDTPRTDENTRRS